jgi:FMN-dependent NADH-azoreductase
VSLNGSPVTQIQLDTTEVATDTIDYVVTDPQGLTSTSTRTVIIQAPGSQTASNDNTPAAANDNQPVTTTAATSTP